MKGTMKLRNIVHGLKSDYVFRAKTLFVVGALASAVLLFTGCDEKPPEVSSQPPDISIATPVLSPSDNDTPEEDKLVESDEFTEWDPDSDEWDRTEDEIHEVLDEAVNNNMMTVCINPRPVFESPEAECDFGIVNSPENANPQMVEIKVDSTGDTLYKSPLIPVGESVDPFAMIDRLNPGTYDCTATFTNVDVQSVEYIGQVEVKLKVVVNALDTTQVTNLASGGSPSSQSDSADNTATSATLLKVTVPTILPVDIGDGKTITVPEEMRISNDSSFDLEVKNVRIAGINGWAPQEYVSFENQDFKINDKSFAMEVGQDITASEENGLIYTPENWPMLEANSAYVFDYKAKVVEQEAEQGLISPAKIVFTITPTDGAKEQIEKDQPAPTTTTSTKTPTSSGQGSGLGTSALPEKHEHTWSAWSDVKKAGCQTSGTAKRTCTTCKKTETKTLPATGHIPVITGAVSATCTAGGKTGESKCYSCGKLMSSSTAVPALGHDYGDYVEQTGGKDCDDDEIWVRTCSRCGDKTTKKYSTDGHKKVKDKGKDATCTEEGLTSGSHCSECGKVFVKQEVIPARGHDPKERAAKDPTCTEAGYSKGTYCSRCDKVFVKAETIPALGHHTVVEPGEDPTCNRPGKTEKKYCNVCNTVFQESQVVPALGNAAHKWTDWAVTVKPGCITKGTESRTCLLCGTVETRETAATGVHEYGEWVVSVAPTCLDGGTEKRSCFWCFNTETRDVDALGHQEIVDEAIPATCSEPGRTAGTHCRRCGLVMKASTEIPTIPHTYGNWQVTKEATCGEAGRESRSCSVCERVEHRELPATGAHDFSDDSISYDEESGKWQAICKVCRDAKDCNTLSASYDALNTLGVTQDSRGNLAIPALIKNGSDLHYTTSIASSGFANKTAVTSVSLPSSISEVGNYAFESCTALTSVSLTNGVTRIGTSVFKGCTNLSTVVLSTKIEEISASMFEGCSAIKGLAISGDTKIIAANAFKDCTGMESITLTASVTDIRSTAFANCTSLKSISIPNSCTTIASDAFDGCTSLASITWKGATYGSVSDFFTAFNS